MDSFFVSLLLLDKGTIITLTFGLIIAGGFAAARLLDVKIAIRRVSYLWCVALLGLALTLSQLLWGLTPAAAEAGLLSPLVIALMGAFALFGAATYYASAARSRHIDGETRRAWMGFVPLVNLWLIFKASEEDDGTSRRRGTLSRFVLDPLLVVGAIFVLTITQTLDRALENKKAFGISDNATLRQMVAEAQTLEQSFATEARMSSGTLPVRIDGITVMSGIEARGPRLVITYDVEREIGPFRPDFEKTLAEWQCAPEMFGADIYRGGIVEMVYRGPDGREIGAFEIDRSDCIS